MSASAAHLDAAEAAVDRALATIGFGGAALALVAGDQTRVRAWGEAAPARPMQTSTPMHICSCSKAFTAYLFARVMGWDQPVSATTPEFDLGDAWLNANVLYRDLAAMRVGLSREGVPEWGIGEGVPVTERLERARYVPRLAPFRDRFTYSNLSYVALGLAAARAGKADLGALFAREVAKVLGLADADFAAGAASPTAALPHLPIDQKMTPVRELTGANSHGSAGARLSADSAAIWIQELCAAANGSRSGALDGALLREMMTPQSLVRDADPRLVGEVSNAAYGFGFLLGRWRGRNLVRHSGGGRGLRAALALLPDENLGVMLLASSETPELEAFALEALAVLAGERVSLSQRYGDHAAQQAKAAWAPWRQPASAPPPKPGLYLNGATGSVTISDTARGLRIAFADAPMFDGALIGSEGGVWRLAFDEPALTTQPNDPPFCLRARDEATLETSYWGVLERLA